MPFSERAGVHHLPQFYAVVKRATELMDHAYCSLFRPPTTGLLFDRLRPPGPARRGAVLVYQEHSRGHSDPGVQPWRHSRNFTYIEDIAQRAIRAQRRHRRPRSGSEQRVTQLPFLECAVPHIQPRCQQPNSAFRPDRRDRGGAPPQGDARPASVSAGRRARQLRRRA